MANSALRLACALLLAVLAWAGGCRSLITETSTDWYSQLVEARLEPSHDRDWSPTHDVLPEVDFDGDYLHVRNIRNFRHYTDHDYAIDYYDRTYRLSDVRTVDFIVTPFDPSQLMAHTMLSFGFADGAYLVASVEVRLEKHETYSPTLGAMRQFELMYVLADERDVILLRADVRNNDVYVYRSTASPAQARDLLLDVMTRVNEVHDYPEFYDTLTNNCTTNIVRHINNLSPGKIPYDMKVLLPGLSPQLAYDLGLLDQRIPFEELKRKANVSPMARRYRDSPDFSQKIRR